MPEMWFTADTHFGHANILRLADRPFASIEEHDEFLTDAWNAVVRPQDTVHHLGDFAYRADPKRAAALFRRLAGTKHLVLGNHDSRATASLGWASEPVLMRQVSVAGERLVLMHYAMRVWPGQWRGALHLFGHSHGRLPGTHASTDVGVDAWPNYCPVNLETICYRLAQVPRSEPEDAPDEPGDDLTP